MSAAPDGAAVPVPGVDTGERAFGGRPVLRGHLARESVLALARRPGRVLVVDRTAERREMKRGFLLALSFSFSRLLRQRTARPRVGIVFPPGLGAFIANLAVVLAGKVPVNLNFTLGPAAVRACLRRGEIDCILTAARVRERFPGFPWPESGVVDLVAELKRLPKARTLAVLAATYLLPASWLARLLGAPAEGGEQEAALLFTSGSSGEPKGVALTHRNILGNCLQIDAAGLLPREERVVGNLPVFHSFGFTVTLWYPLLRGCRVVTLPSPLETAKVAAAVEEEKATVLIGTPTFLKPYLKRARPAQLASLKYVIAGAEKTPAGFAEKWEESFGCPCFEGYGLTETSPVVSVNLPGSGEAGGPRSRRGSVGRLLPGQAARILDPDTREDLPPHRRGLLALRGANVFGGYLGEAERTAEVMAGDGWFVTGDLARFDADGFLFIEGRLSRFSKIGGEMVPHGVVEEALLRALAPPETDAPVLAVAGRPDAAKGESLVVLTTLEIGPAEVRAALAGAGLPMLWIPREVRRVEAIPSLASGKLDLQGLRRMAEGEGLRTQRLNDSTT
jgi:acyl-[acyl-carrier-protein]-phospholipid O-acyltransferase/long-chain-fatty-acid--[acyl-carrier-protein] ligase